MKYQHILFAIITTFISSVAFAEEYIVATVDVAKVVNESSEAKAQAKADKKKAKK